MADTSVDVEDENILTSIFKESFPDSWQENPEFVKYLVELSSYGVQKLAQEPDRLSEEKAQILEETQDLAFHNYTTFIQTATCSKEIFQDFQIIEQHLDDLLTKLPDFAEECNKVLTQAQHISSSRRMNTLTLQRHTQLLEVLEMPQLMDTCVRNGYYEEALELAAHVRRLEKKHSNIPVIMSMVEEVKQSTQLMLGQLIQQLRSNLQLPACLRVIGYLRRMEVFTEPELRIKFLQARDSWFQSILDAIPKDDPYTHITKTIEASRVHLFDIITQFRAIFSDEDPILSSALSSSSSLGRDDTLPDSALFHSWLVEKVSQFLRTLEGDLNRGVGGRLDSLLGQCMYFGLSFSRVGADFRALLAPVFHNAALHYFQAALKEANAKFEENMQSYNLLGVTSSGGMNYTPTSQGGQLYPPTILLDFYPLAAYCNHVLTAFNDLRLCAPVNLVCHVMAALSSSLHEVNRVILAFHRAEETTFNQRERAQFEQLVCAYMTDLLPFLSRCLQALFPPPLLSHTLGVSLSELTRKGNLGTLDLNPILQSVQHLVPVTKEEPPELASPPSPALSPQGEPAPPVATEEQTTAASPSSLASLSLQQATQEPSAQDVMSDSSQPSADVTVTTTTTGDEMAPTASEPEPASAATTEISSSSPSGPAALSSGEPTELSAPPPPTAARETTVAAAQGEGTAASSSSWLDSEEIDLDEIDLDNLPEAWGGGDEGEGELAFLSEGGEGEGTAETLDAGLAASLAAGLVIGEGEGERGKTEEEGSGEGGKDVKKQD